MSSSVLSFDDPKSIKLAAKVIRRSFKKGVRQFTIDILKCDDYFKEMWSHREPSEAEEDVFEEILGNIMEEFETTIETISFT
jgi:hypothetical protein